MDDLRLQAVAARVVAWHNRHPLARRISAQQVKSVGYVALTVGASSASSAAPAQTAEPEAPSDRWASSAAAVAASPAEDDYAAAFAALAEPRDGPTAAAENPARSSAPTVDARDAVDEPADGFEIELDIAPDAAQAAHAAQIVEGSEAAEAAEAGDVATLVAAEPQRPLGDPSAAASAAEPALPLHIPTLRDRLLDRAQRPAVQGALLAAHDGYSPSVRPPAQALEPAWAQGGGVAEAGEGDRFMAPFSPRDVARWVARHGRALLQPPVDGPLRRVSTAAVAGGPTSGVHYVLTAAIAGGGLTSRVLVGAGSPGAVLGLRLWSGPRVAMAALLGTLLLVSAAVAVGLGLRPAQAPVAAAQTAGADAAASAPTLAASAPTAAASAEAAEARAVPLLIEGAASAADAEGGVVAAAATGGDLVAGAAPGAAAGTVEAPVHEPDGVPPHGHAPAGAPVVPAPAAAARELQISTARPPPAYAKKGPVGLPARALQLSEDDKAAARAAVAAARAGRPAAERTAASEPPPGAAADQAAAAPAAPTAPPPAARAVLPVGPVFAVSTRSLRTRAEAEQWQAAMTALLAAPGAAGRHVDLLPEGDDWRVVAWPFSGQADADRFRALLAARGMKVGVVQF